MKPSFLGLAGQIAESRSLVRDYCFPKPRGVSKIFFCGLGGSAASGDILRTLLSPGRPLPFSVCRSGDLPSWVDRKTLAVFSSYSGNTAEALSAFQKASAAGAKLFAVTSGGKMAGLAQKRKAPCLLIPPGMPPRFALGYLSFSLILTFKKWGWLRLENGEIEETIRTLRHLDRNPALGRTLARRLSGRSIHIYAVRGRLLEPVARRWRAQFAENAKTLASHGLLPEMFHNEIEAWQFPRPVIKKSAAVFLTDRGDPSWIQRKKAQAQHLIRRGGARVLEVQSRGRSPLARIFSLVGLGDQVSLELAGRYGVDPVSIPSIEQLKKI